jgi:hypothetical protein
MDLNRRAFLRNAVGYVTVVTTATALGTTLLASAAEATPLTAGKALTDAMESYVQKTQATVVVTRGSRRRRRWTCWWRRGRRVCGWR